MCAHALIPLLQSAAARIDAARKLPKDVPEAMHGAGMFRRLIPRAYGGFELKPSHYVRCVEAIAIGDASAAWCMNQASGCSMTAAYLTPELSREIWGARHDVLAWGQGPGAKAIRTEGGWRCMGTWSFASGSRHATRLGAMCVCFREDGSPVLHGDGKPRDRTMLSRRELARIDDVWQVVGLRGTGSDTYSIEDLFVDDAHSVTRESPAERREAGVLYRFPAMQLYASGFACVGLGIARVALDACIALTKGKSQARSSDRRRDNHAVQHIIWDADAALKAAKSGLLTVLDEQWEAVGRTGEPAIDGRIAVRQAATFEICTARDVVHQAYHEAGSTAVFDNQPFERRLRDVNSVLQQLQGRRTRFETVGLYLIGWGAEPALGVNFCLARWVQIPDGC